MVLIPSNGEANLQEIEEEKQIQINKKITELDAEAGPRDFHCCVPHHAPLHVHHRCLAPPPP